MVEQLRCSCGRLFDNLPGKTLCDVCVWLVPHQGEMRSQSLQQPSILKLAEVHGVQDSEINNGSDQNHIQLRSKLDKTAIQGTDNNGTSVVLQLNESSFQWPSPQPLISIHAHLQFLFCQQRYGGRQNNVDYRVCNQLE